MLISENKRLNNNALQEKDSKYLKSIKEKFLHNKSKYFMQFILELLTIDHLEDL